MNKLDYLINYLLEERGESGVIPEDYEAKERLWRALVNVREPIEISEEYLENEKIYLSERLKKYDLVDCNNLKSVKDEFNIDKDKMYLYLGDITKLIVDAVVNPANEGGTGCYIANHNCLDNQITTYGGVSVRIEDKIRVDELGGKLSTGKAMITNAYNLPCKYIIHTTGPYVNNELTDNERHLLEECYKNCLDLARENNIRTIAFPTISTGVFKFPKDEAARIAIKTVSMYLDKYRESFDKVIFCVYTEDDLDIYKRELGVL